MFMYTPWGYAHAKILTFCKYIHSIADGSKKEHDEWVAD